MDEASITAVADDGYEFVRWAEGSEDGKIISSTGTWYFTADGPRVFYAVFSKEHRHVWGEWKRIKEPTETENGLAERVCELDPTHVETVNLYYNDGGNDGTDGQENAPTGNGGRTSPETGVKGSPVIWTLIALVAAVPVGMIVKDRKRNNKN